MDLEGHELDAFSEWPWEDMTVGVFIVETGPDPCNGKCQKIRKLLKLHDYVRANVENRGVDDYFVLSKYWIKQHTRKAWRIHPENSSDC